MIYRIKNKFPTVKIYILLRKTNVIIVSYNSTHLSFCSVQFVFSNPFWSFFTPESCRLLLLMSSSFRLEFDLRTVARAEQLSSVRPHLRRLKY